MSKRLKELGIYADMKIDAQKIIEQANARLNSIPSERKIFMRYKKIKVAVIAAAITVLCIATAFAADNIISYFNSNEAKKVGDVETLNKYNEAISKTVTKGDKTLTLDNLAIDDSYLYVFYTLTAPEDYTFNTVCFIDGNRANNPSAWDSYMIDERTIKGVVKISVAHTEVPEQFNFEMYCLDALVYDDYCEYRNKYDENYFETLNNEEKSKLLYISTTAHKSDIKEETMTKEVNAEIPVLNSTLNKVIISPFGSQLVITQHELNRRYMSDSFAVQDENGNFIHLSPENSRIYEEGDTEEVRTVPIMFGGNIPESLTVIPYGEEPEISMIDADDEHRAEDFPFELKISDRGKVIVTDIRYFDAKMEIDYRLEGDTWGLQKVYPINNDGWNEMLADDGVWWIDETEYHQSTGSYTAVFNFVIGEADGNGNVPSAKELRSADILRNKFTGVMMSYQSNPPELDYDNAVKVNLK